MIYVRGDTHGEFAGVAAFCAWNETTPEDILIILGDAGINGAEKKRDEQVKRFLADLPVTLFCVHGNHDRRPETVSSYREIRWKGGICFREERYPNLLFARDGEIFDLEGSRSLVIGGAASSDKYYRLARGLPWWEDEKPSKEIKRRTEANLSAHGWTVDQVFSHTLPLQYIPSVRLEEYRKTGNPDLSAERWLGKLEERMQYKKWYSGHWHMDAQINEKVEVLYRNYRVLQAECAGNHTESNLECKYEGKT